MKETRHNLDEGKELAQSQLFELVLPVAGGAVEETSPFSRSTVARLPDPAANELKRRRVRASVVHGKLQAKPTSHAKSLRTNSRMERLRNLNDRFIPNRAIYDLTSAFHLMHEDGSPTMMRQTKRAPNDDLHFFENQAAGRIYTSLLRSEMDLPVNMPQHFAERFVTRRLNNVGTSSLINGISLPGFPAISQNVRKNLLSFGPLRHPVEYSHSLTQLPCSLSVCSRAIDVRAKIFDMSTLKYSSQRLLLGQQNQARSIAKYPYRIMDAPGLVDDFYRDLVDWGTSGVAFGLATRVYVYDCTSHNVTMLCDMGQDFVTSLSWLAKGSHLAVGTQRGFVQIWDAATGNLVRTMTGHRSRVGALAWNEYVVSSGSRDCSILHRDVRVPDQFIQRLLGHKQEVCSLEWNYRNRQLATGGDDNRLLIWHGMSTDPLWVFTEHRAAIKGVAWSSHQEYLLASGGGRADRKIRFWNTITGTMIQEIDTGSQICNLAWSKNSNELISTHGSSLNQIAVWKYPSLTHVANLTGHSQRVLHLAMSPDGTAIVTGAGDETLRFWNCFKRKDSLKLPGRFDHPEGIR